jgi:hypothetical protein
MSWDYKGRRKGCKANWSNQAYSLFVKVIYKKKKSKSLGLFLASMTEAIGCNLAMFIFSYTGSAARPRATKTPIL